MSKSIVEQANKKGRNLTEKQVALLDNARSNGFDLKKAALDAGYGEKSIYQAINSLKDEIIELTELTMIQHGPLAAKTHVDILTATEPVTQGALKLSASQSILDRIGLGKRDSLKVEHEVSGGIFIMPAKAPLQEKIINE